MRKLTVVWLTMALVLILSTPVLAQFKFDISEGFNFFSDSRIEGMNRHFGFGFDVSDDINVGFYYENADLQLTGDVGATPPNTTKMRVNAKAMRVLKKLTKWLDAGFDIGTAKIQQGTTSGAFAATGGLNQNKPLVGVLANLHYGVTSGEKIATDIHLDLGYRFVDLNDIAITGAPAGEGTVDDLNAFIIGLGLGLKF
ncbi:MAG: hypothetical protein LHV69_08240 [Elusimicrobia bacterium]|nr:hypothetical protein [Candidatus Obscuribacterium magneticum]